MPDREEIWGERLWEALEQIRAADAPHEVADRLGRELPELAETLRLAAALRDTVPTGDDVEGRRAAVRQRLMGACEGVRLGEAATTPAHLPWISGFFARRPMAAWSLAALMLVGLASGSFLAGRRSVPPPPPPAAQVVQKPVIPVIDKKIRCRQAKAEFARLLNGRCEPEEQGTLWVHVTHCEGCFRTFKGEWEHHHPHPGGNQRSERKAALLGRLFAQRTD